MGQFKIQKSLPVNQQRTADAQDKKLRNAANMYEERFLNTMVEQMRRTVPKSKLVKKSYAESYFQNKLDQKYVKAWTNKGGIGLSDIIYNQIQEKITGASRYVARPQGPLKVSPEKSMMDIPKEPKVMPYKIQQGPAPEGEQGQNFYFKKNSDEAPSKIHSPWAGEVNSKKQIGDNTILKINHENEMQSVLSFNGQDPGLRAGDKLRPGQEVGELSNNAGGFLWSVRLKS